jgi:MOSC domain-containing protein YiiM
MGWVEAIFTAPAEALPVVRRARVVAQPGVGLDCDRYANGTGYWSGDKKVSRDLTLVEAEIIEAVNNEMGLSIDTGALRRNVVTRGIRLNDLVGARFRVGNVLAEGTSLCEPCDHLARIVDKPILRPLIHRAGLRANVLSVGDIVEGARIDLDVPRVGVGVIVKHGRLYLLGLRRGPRGNRTWSTPGGELRRAEGVLECALRELREETDMVGERPRVVAQSCDRLDDGHVWCSVFVAVDIRERLDPIVREPDACVRWGWFEPRHFPNPLFAPVGSICGSPTY